MVRADRWGTRASVSAHHPARTRDVQTVTLTIGHHDPDTVAAATARMLIEIDAVHIRPAEPFTYTSGLKSPVYIDCRRIISFPRVRTALMEFAVATVLSEAGFEAFDAVAGGETAGIPFAAWIADRLALPMVYVRKQPKGFGRNALIEGASVDGKRVLLVEDLATDGGSKVRFAGSLRSAGATVEHAVVVFYYDIFESAGATLAAAGLRLHRLATWRSVLGAARSLGRLDAEDAIEVERFLAAPFAWSAAHGGIAAPAPSGTAPPPAA